MWRVYCHERSPDAQGKYLTTYCKPHYIALCHKKGIKKKSTLNRMFKLTSLYCVQRLMWLHFMSPVYDLFFPIKKIWDMHFFFFFACHFLVIFTVMLLLRIELFALCPISYWEDDLMLTGGFSAIPMNHLKCHLQHFLFHYGVCVSQSIKQ